SHAMIETLPEFLLHWAERAPDTVFVTEPDRGRSVTYGQVAAQVGRFRARLRSLGVGCGDRVAILADNSADWVVAYLAAIAHGAAAAPLNTRPAAGDRERVLDDLDPAAVVGDPAYLSRVSGDHRSRRLVPMGTDATRPDTSAIDGSEARPAEVGVLCYTSGTTGDPRGVMIHNSSLVRNAAMFAQLFQSGSDSATAVVCPLFHNTGYNDGLAHVLLAGGRVDVPRRFDPPAVARALAEGPHTVPPGVPAVC